MDHVGPIWWRRDEGGALAFGFVADRRHANLIGVVQGGMLMTFADRALGRIAIEAAGERPSVTIDFHMQFVDAARIGSFVECRGDVVRLTRDLVFCRGLLTAGDRPVAGCSGTWKVLRPGRRSPLPAAIP